MKWLKGKKTYIVAAGAVLTSIGAYLSGQLSLVELIALTLNGATAASLRSGVKSDVRGE